MRPFEVPDLLTPDQRLSEVAGILTTGILRLQSRAALPDSDAPKNLALVHFGESQEKSIRTILDRTKPAGYATRHVDEGAAETFGRAI